LQISDSVKKIASILNKLFATNINSRLFTV